MDSYLNSQPTSHIPGSGWKWVGFPHLSATHFPAIRSIAVGKLVGRMPIKFGK